jgi:hypothetical protein
MQASWRGAATRLKILALPAEAQLAELSLDIGASDSKSEPMETDEEAELGRPNASE